MGLFRWCGAAALSLGLCAPVAAEELPQWLIDARAREATPGALTDVASQDSWLRARVAGKVGHPIVLDGGGYSLEIAAAEGVNVSCEVLKGSQDLASLLLRTAELSFERLGEVHGKVEARVVEASDAGAVGPNPFMSLQWFYRASRQGEVRVGGLKQFAALLDDAVVYCAHDDLGYVETFGAVARALVADLRTAAAPTVRNDFREVGTVSLDGQRIGVFVNRLDKDADGDTRASSTTAVLLQTAPGQLIAQDTGDVQWVRPDGSLINASLAKADNGTLVEDMTLRRDDEGRWRARGTLRGKAIDVEMPAAPSSFVQLAKARQALMARDDPVGATHDATTWSALDSSRLLPTRATVLAVAGENRYAVREELAGVAIELVLDRQTGTMASSRMPLGARVMAFERIFQQGSL